MGCTHRRSITLFSLPTSIGYPHVHTSADYYRHVATWHGLCTWEHADWVIFWPLPLVPPHETFVYSLAHRTRIHIRPHTHFSPRNRVRVHRSVQVDSGVDKHARLMERDRVNHLLKGAVDRVSNEVPMGMGLMVPLLMSIRKQWIISLSVEFIKTVDIRFYIY